jgi:hypothetical protein
MRSLLRRAALLVLPAVLTVATLPTAARAQNLVDAMTRAAIEAMGAAGLRLEGHRSGSLRDQSATDVEMQIPAGKTVAALIGVCDEDCTDLDLAVFSGSGTKLGEDVDPDNSPLVAVRNHSGPIRVRVTMASCTVAPCAYRVMLFVP